MKGRLFNLVILSLTIDKNGLKKNKHHLLRVISDIKVLYFLERFQPQKRRAKEGIKNSH